MKLYELTEAYERILELAEQLDDGSMKDTLDSLNDAIEVKAENTAKVIRQLDASAEMLKTEINRLTERKQAIENNTRNLKRYLQESLEKVGMEKVKGELFTVAIQNNPQSVEVLDESKIPKDYFVEQEPKLKKHLLLASLKQGEEIAGVELKQTRSLRIR